MRREALSRFRTISALLAATCIFVGLYTAPLRAEISIDGRLDEPEWRNAQRCENWRRTAPFARDEPRYGNELALLSLPQGLVAAFVIQQPPDERRIKPRTPRDSESLIGDSVSLMIDFDATGQIGYEFSVGLGGGVRDGLITNQNTFDRDWDGFWRHAVTESADGWVVEILVPWSTVKMRASGVGERTIGVYGSRYLYERNERYACPGIVADSAVFLSDFQRIRIEQHEVEGELEATPYVTAIHDLVEDSTRFKAGADFMWKASPQLWLAATLNPDFGQVESDELVVDFSAIETVLTDKRPFFTENQGVFDLRTPANGQLIYTRRIGAAPDRGNAGSSDIDAAFKLTGGAGPLVYGAFVAQESDYDRDVGRLFAAGRLALPLERSRAGYLATWVDRPALQRQALANAVDFEITPGESLRFSGQLIRTDIHAPQLRQVLVDPSLPPAREQDSHGYQGWLQADINRSAPISHTLTALYIDDRFDLNDLGYMERNDLQQIEWETHRRIAGGAERPVSGETQRFYTFWRRNSEGQRLPSRIQLSRDVQYSNAWRAYQELRYLTSGVDDLISRDNGPVQLDARTGAYFDVASPRYGDWQFMLGGYVFQQGVKDYSGWLETVVSWYPTEKLTLRLDLLPQLSQDWLLWEAGNLFGSYRAKRLDFDFRVDWIPAPRHELRLKWQWIGVDAQARSAYRADARGALRRSEDELAPFTVSNLGLQLRYRYEFARQSELFLVYARGGFQLLNDDRRDLGALFGDLTRLRDADQFLVKIRYRL